MWVFGIALTPPTKNTILAFFKFVKYLFTISIIYFCPTLLTWHGSCFTNFNLVRVAWRISLDFVCDSVLFLATIVLVFTLLFAKFDLVLNVPSSVLG